MSEEVEQLSCQELVELVTDYLERALPPDDVARFETHIATCTGCRNYVEQMRATVELTGGLSPAAIPAAAEAALLNAFRNWKSR